MRKVRSGYRYYSPELGRWPSRDPVVEVGSISWIQRREAIRKIRNELGRRGADARIVNALMEALQKRHGPNTYAFCLNNSINIYDLLGELSCISKGLQLAAIEGQITSVEVAIGFTTIAVPMAVLELTTALGVEAAAETALLLAEQALSICLAFQATDPCRDCSIEELAVATCENSVEMAEAQVQQYQDDLDTLYETLALLTQQLADLSVEFDTLWNTPCTWP